MNTRFQSVSFDLEPPFSIPFIRAPDLSEISLPISTYVPGRVFFDPPTLRISHQDILDATETEFLDGLLSEYTVEEREQVRQGLSLWVDEKLQESGLDLPEESKVNLINVMALIMKKVSEMLHESEG